MLKLVRIACRFDRRVVDDRSVICTRSRPEDSTTPTVQGDRGTMVDGLRNIAAVIGVVHGVWHTSNSVSWERT